MSEKTPFLTFQLLPKNEAMNFSRGNLVGLAPCLLHKTHFQKGWANKMFVQTRFLLTAEPPTCHEPSSTHLWSSWRRRSAGWLLPAAFPPLTPPEVLISGQCQCLRAFPLTKCRCHLQTLRAASNAVPLVIEPVRVAVCASGKAGLFDVFCIIPFF